MGIWKAKFDNNQFGKIEQINDNQFRFYGFDKFGKHFDSIGFANNSGHVQIF